MFFRCITPDMAAILKNDFMNSLPRQTYMAGGTAAALYFGHRLSVDIDLFTPAEFDSLQVFHDLNENMRGLFEKVTLHKLEKNTLVASLKDTGLSLFSYPYGLLREPTPVPGILVPVASVLDLTLMKLIAINQRGSCKDFVDLKTILTHSSESFSELVIQLQKKYHIGEEMTLQLKKSLIYFDDAEEDLNISLFNEETGTFQILDKKTWQDVRRFFEELVLK